MAQPPITVQGRFHKLARKVGKIGSEHIVFQVTSHNIELWDNFVAMAEGDVTLEITPRQGQLPIGDEGNGTQPLQGITGGRGRKKGKPTDDATAIDQQQV